MHGGHQREQISEQIEANTFGVFGGGGLLLFASLGCAWGPLPLLVAMLGVAYFGWISTRPTASPPSFIPRAPGFQTEIAEESVFLDTLPPPRWARVRALIVGELLLLAVLALVSALTRPWWPPSELGWVLVMLFIAFLAGGLIAMCSCWIQVYKDLLRSAN